jgi:hypothetical protein
MSPLWVIERFAYYTLFALIVLAIEQFIRDVKWDMLKVNEAISDRSITAIALAGITLLFIWVIFH